MKLHVHFLQSALALALYISYESTRVRGGQEGGARRTTCAAPPSGMNRVKEIQRVNAKDVALQLKADTVGNAGKWDVNKSWHAQYKDSAYVYAGGLPLDLSEGDLIVIFSQFGEVVDVNMPRDQKTGKPMGFCFVA